MQLRQQSRLVLKLRHERIALFQRRPQLLHLLRVQQRRALVLTGALLALLQLLHQLGPLGGQACGHLLMSDQPLLQLATLRFNRGALV